MTTTQMKYLLALAAQDCEKQKNAADVARQFDVNRSTVSRALSAFIDEGILDQRFLLTSYGKSFVLRFGHRHKKIIYWLMKNGIDEETATEDALRIMTRCSEEMIQLMEQGGELCKACSYFGEKGHKLILDGNSLYKYIPRGDYRVAFGFYKGRKREPQQISMADTAFHHPAVLTVSEQSSNLKMKYKKVEQKSMRSRKLMSGEVQAVKYEYENQIKAAVLKDGYANLSLEAMQFSYLQEEDILQGELKLFLSSSVGEMHMPECTAMLRLYL